MKKPTENFAKPVLVLLAAALPFVFYTGPVSFTLPRTVLLQMCAGAAAIALLAGTPRARLAVRTPLAIFILALACAALAASFHVAAVKPLVFYISCAVLAACAAAAFHDHKSMARLCAVVVAAGLVMAAHGIIQSHTPLLSALEPLRGRFTVIATAGSPAMLAGWLAPALCLAAAMCFGAQSPSARGVLTIVCAVMILCLFLTMSRSGWVAAAAGLSATLLLLVWISRINWRAAASRLLMIFLATALLAGARDISIHTFLKNTHAPRANAVMSQAVESETKHDSVRLRLFLLNAAEYMAARRPLLGHGPGAFRMLYPETQAHLLQDPHTRREDGDVATGRMADYAHNEYMEILVEAGIAGLLAFLALLAAGGRHALRRIQAHARTGDAVLLCGGAGALAAMLVQAGFEFTLHLPLTAALFWMLFGACCSEKISEIVTERPPGATVRILRAAGATGAAVLILAAPLPWFAAHNLEHGVSLAQEGRFEDAAAALDRAAAQDPASSDVLYSRAGVRVSQGEPDRALDDLDHALTLSRSPSLFLARGAVLRMLHMPERAKQDFQTAAAMDPWRPEALYHLAVLARDRGDEATARSLCAHALELAPDFAPARTLMQNINKYDQQ